MITGISSIIGILILAYLLGSFPTGYLVGKWLKGIDMREVGSGSTGATNVLRTLGKWPAIVVLAVDIFKGSGAVLLGIFLYTRLQFPEFSALPAEWVGCLAALVALLGHSKPIWLNFRGGKSVATGLGVLFAMNWLAALGTLGAFGLMLALFRIVSLGSIVAAISINLLMWLMGQPLAYKCFAFVGGLYIIWRHQSNIQRLIAGTEPKIGQPLVQNTTPEVG